MAQHPWVRGSQIHLWWNTCAFLICQNVWLKHHWNSNYFWDTETQSVAIFLKDLELLKVESINAMLEETGIYFTFYKLCVIYLKYAKTISSQIWILSWMFLSN